MVSIGLKKKKTLNWPSSQKQRHPVQYLCVLRGKAPQTVITKLLDYNDVKSYAKHIDLCATHP